MPAIDITQHGSVVHIPKDQLQNILVHNEDMTKLELRVFIYLLTDLDGFNTERRELTNRSYSDPLNYKAISMKLLAKELNSEKKLVKSAVEGLLLRGIIEKGDSQTIQDGYRFTF